MFKKTTELQFAFSTCEKELKQLPKNEKFSKRRQKIIQNVLAKTYYTF